MALQLNRDHLEAIRDHGRRDYPTECCGILLGHAKGDHKQVVEVIALKNLRREPEKARELLPVADPDRETERNRFLIDPRDQLRIEKGARAKGLEVVGYYHSHPDHPAQPSSYDREHAWPWYSYVIVSVQDADPKEVNSWVLAADRSRFEPEAIQLANSPHPHAAPVHLSEHSESNGL